MFETAPKKSFFPHRITTWSIELSRLNSSDIMMHDANIKEKTKAKYKFFSLVTLL